MVVVKLIIRILLLPVRISLTIVQLVVMFINMAVRNCISYPVWDYLYHSYIGIWIRAGNRHRDD